MHELSLPLAILFLLAAPACRSTEPGQPDSRPTAGTPAAAAGEKGGERTGVLAPLDAAPIALWPEAHAGSFLVLEVAPHGALLQAGDTVARLDARAIDEELHRAELELSSATITHEGLLARNRLDEQAARAALERARAALERTRRSLAGWKEQELAFERRSDELEQRYEQANVEDQNDELDQLQKMYEADELVDATEDIVLKRSRRGLALTQARNELSRDSARHHQELELALQTEQREEAFRAEAEALARLEELQAIEARSRADAELRSADALALQREKLERLRRDRELFVLRAPRAGLLLHGDPDQYRPGKAPARVERGSQLTPRSEVFALAAPEPGAVAFDFPDTERARFVDGASVEVRALAGDGAASSGRVEVDPYAKSLSAGETTLEALAALERPLPGAHYGERVRIVLGEQPSVAGGTGP